MSDRTSRLSIWATLLVGIFFQSDAYAGPITFVIDVNGGGDGGIGHLTVYNGDLYFEGRDGAAAAGLGSELLRYNSGTNAVSLAADVNTGLPNGFIGDMAVYEGELYFEGRSPGNTSILHRYDGTTVTAIPDSNVVNTASGPTVFNGDLYIGAQGNPSTTPVGTELFRYNGSDISNVNDIGVSGSVGTNASHKAVLGDRLYFNGNDLTFTGDELYYITNLSDSPVFITDLRPGNSSSNPRFLTAFDGKLYFAAADVPGQSRLFVYDPNTNNISLAALSDPDNVSSIEHITVFDNSLYFSAIDTSHGRELRRFDGTTISLVEDFIPGLTGSDIRGLAVYDDELYFGNRRTLSAGDIDLYKLSASSAAVPEPSSIALSIFFMAILSVGRFIHRGRTNGMITKVKEA